MDSSRPRQSNNNKPRIDANGLRNRRQSDSLQGDVSYYNNRRSSSSQSDTDYGYFRNDTIEIIRRDNRPTVSQFSTPKPRFVRQINDEAVNLKRQRTARCLSVAITSFIVLCLCVLGIETSVSVIHSAVSYISSSNEADTSHDLISQKRRRSNEIKKQLAQIQLEEKRLRGPPERTGAMSHRDTHINNGEKVDDGTYKTNQVDKSDEQNNGLNYLGKDATFDFFYAGKFTHHEEHNADEPDSSFTAYSYATLPFSDCNPFVLSVWIHLSPNSESAADDEDDKQPRVIWTTKTEDGVEGCNSELFSSSFQPASGMVVYAHPHYSDNDGGKSSYRVLVDYGVKGELSCRTLGGVKTGIIQEGEWHHVVLFVSRTGSKSEIEAKKGVERISLYLDGYLVATDEIVSNRVCASANDPTTLVGRFEMLESSEPDPLNNHFDLNGRIGMLAYWETGGPELITKPLQRMQVQTTRDEEHVVRGINRARFDIGAIRELSLQGLTVKEPSLLYTFDEQGDANNHTKLLMPSEATEVMTGLHGEIVILSPFMKTTVDLSLDNQPFVPLGGNRYLEYKDGTFVPPKRSRIEIRQLDELARARSLRVREAMGHLWRGYKKYAWGRDELLPLSNGGQDNWGGMGTTLVDSLSTLWLLGMKDEFYEARDWVKYKLNFNNVKKAVSVFETTIRNLGSLLSAYDLSGDRAFLEKADDLGNRLLRAFNTPSGVPHGEVELFDGGRAFNTHWHAPSACLSEIGTLQIEFRYLAHATGKTEFASVAMRALDELLKLETEDGLYPTLIHNLKSSLSFANDEISIGAMGDSFYEYLLKIWLQGGKTEPFYRKVYDKAMDGIIDKLICKRNGLTYVAELKNGRLDHKMDHLSCFLGGNMALGAFTHPLGLQSAQAQRQLITGKQLAYTCYQMYARGKFGLPPEYIKFSGARDDFTTASDAPYYILRPETSETFFILHHLTKDPVYREWGWEIFRAIDRWCRTESGFAALRNVNTAQQNNRMESFFPAETLKYLYLLQDNSHKLDLMNKHVFNTEAHPLRWLPQLV